MSNSKKKSNYYKGIRIFQKNENQPCYSGVITPNILIEFLKSGEADGAKTEYNGQTQFKFSLWTNNDGSASMTINDYQPTQKAEVNEVAEEGGDLPF